MRAERVEVVPHGEDELSVLVEGRLEDARRLPSRAILVVEAASGGKHRFTQVAEPGDQAGMRDRRWAARFLVPAALTSSLAGRTTLFIGGEEIPLPGADRAPAGRRRKAAPAVEAAPPAVRPSPEPLPEPLPERAALPPLPVLDEAIQTGSRASDAMRDLLGELRALESDLGDWEREAQAVS